MQVMRTLTSSPLRRPPRPPLIARSAIELAAVCSTIAVLVAYALHEFAGVGEAPIVIGVLVVASIVGWTQPAVRNAPRPTGRLAPHVIQRAARRSG
jgi:hypothetical protein